MIRHLTVLLTAALLAGCATYRFPEYTLVPDPGSRQDLQPYLAAADDVAFGILKAWNEKSDPGDPINGGHFALSQYSRTVSDGRQADGTPTLSVHYKLMVPTGFFDGVNHFTVLVEKDSGKTQVF